MKLTNQIKLSFYAIGILLIVASKLFKVPEYNTAMSIASICLSISLFVDAFAYYRETKKIKGLFYLAGGLFFILVLLYLWMNVL